MTMGMPSSSEIIIIVVLIVLLFGSAKIPAIARNIADGIKTFKKEIKDEPVEKKGESKKKRVKKTAVKKKTK